ncbi:hypothetical protein Tco_0441682 [Tanacetum coccineum]
MVLIFVKDSWNEEPCSDVHQVGDEREVEVMRSFNWPLSELITEDGVLPERGYSQFNDVSSGYLDTLYRKSPRLALGWCSVFCGATPGAIYRTEVAQPQVNPDPTIAQVEQITPFR